MWKKIIGAVVLVALIGGGLAGMYMSMIKGLIAASANQTMPPEAVALAEVKAVSWERTLPAVGTVTAYQGVMVVAEAQGVVREIGFEGGEMVEAGAVLAVLDSDVETAQLRAAEANLELARTNARRARDLYNNRTISQAELDTAEATLKSAEAEVARIRAVIDKKTIRAPFAGRLGIRQISLGQYLKIGDPVVILQALDPVFVEFLTPQRNLAVLSEGLETRVTTDAFPGIVFRGEVSALNPQVDAASRNVKVQATVPNPDGLLRPGMFVDVEVVLPEQREVLIIPQTAVLFAPYGNSVFIVEEGEPDADGMRPLVARQQFIRTGEARGDFIVVTSGLEAGQRVVSAGAFKLRNGSRVFESDVAVPEP
ncbi:MAG: efflux RND transporter periplasmic adaptor subunit, partial [Verrucomicrobia bacterium]